MPGDVNNLKAAVAPVSKHKARAQERVPPREASRCPCLEWKRSGRIPMENQSFDEMLLCSNQELIYSPPF